MIAKTIRTCFPIAAAAVSDKAEEINKLNVFPVPDGDTGTNMSLTLASVTKELSALPADADMEAIAGSITHGCLPGCPQAHRGHDPHGPARCLDQGRRVREEEVLG